MVRRKGLAREGESRSGTGDGEGDGGSGLGRKLPHDLEAERSILGALLIDCKRASGVFQLLTPEDFYSPRHGRIYGVFQTLYDLNSTFDEVVAVAEMKRLGIEEPCGGMAYLVDIVEHLPTAANAELYAKIVREKSILRALAGACGEISQKVYESEASAQDQLDTAEQRILEIGERNMGRDFIQIGEILDANFDRLSRAADEDDRTVPSGFTDLDSMTTGFHPAELIIVAGRPSMGKTSFSMNCVENAAMAGKRVAIFSLEVARDQLVQNLLCSYARVDAHRVRQRSLSRDIWEKLIDGASQLSQARIFIDDTPGLTPLALKAKARRLKAREDINLVVIDYLQLMEGGGSAESRQQEISMVSRSLKSLARELSVPVITISQLSRGVENRESHKPRLSDLRESGAIEQDADLVLLLYREEYYKPEKEEARGKAEIIIAKQRNGPTGSVHLAFQNKYMRFENLTERYEEPGGGGPVGGGEEFLSY